MLLGDILTWVFVVRADEHLTAFVELESVTSESGLYPT
jgi:hypothetical protein